MTSKDYNRINELLSEFSSLTAAVEGAEAEIKTVQLAAAKELLPKHAAAKFALAALEESIRKIADEHYQALFPNDEKRTHKTPFGELHYRKSTSLEVPDEEKTILKIKVESDKAAAGRGMSFRTLAEALIRTREELNLEALEKHPDEFLDRVGVRRVSKDNFSIKPFAMKSDKPAKQPKTPAA